MDLTTPIINSRREIFVVKNLDKTFTADSFKNDPEEISRLRKKIDRLLYYISNDQASIFGIASTAKKLVTTYVYLKVLSSKINKSIFTINYGDIIKNVNISNDIHPKILDTLSDDLAILGFPFERNISICKWVNNNGLKFIFKLKFSGEISDIIYEGVLYYGRISGPGEYYNNQDLSSPIIDRVVRLNDHDMLTIYNEDIDTLRINLIKEIFGYVLSAFGGGAYIRIPFFIYENKKMATVDTSYKITNIELHDSIYDLYVDLELSKVEIDTNEAGLDEEEIKQEIIMSLNGLRKDQYRNHPMNEKFLKEGLANYIGNYINSLIGYHRLSFILKEAFSIFINNATG